LKIKGFQDWCFEGKRFPKISPHGEEQIKFEERRA